MVLIKKIKPCEFQGEFLFEGKSASGETDAKCLR